VTEIAFGDELEVFRKEEEVAQQYFFAWLQIRTELTADEKLLDRLNDTPLFWITAHHALLLAAFVALGRVFDQGSSHNVNALLKMASKNKAIFTKDALRVRKIGEGVTPAFAAEYVVDKYEASDADFRDLRREVAKRQRVYEERFRDVRDKIFAHKELADHDEMNALLGRATIDELKSLFGFLHALHEALWQLLVNGRRPILRLPDFKLPTRPRTLSHGDAPGEIVARDVATFFDELMAPDRHGQAAVDPVR
jgi:hypothetical protein